MTWFLAGKVRAVLVLRNILAMHQGPTDVRGWRWWKKRQTSPQFVWEHRFYIRKRQKKVSAEKVMFTSTKEVMLVCPSV